MLFFALQPSHETRLCVTVLLRRIVAKEPEVTRNQSSVLIVTTSHLRLLHTSTSQRSTFPFLLELSSSFTKFTFLTLQHRQAYSRVSVIRSGTLEMEGSPPPKNRIIDSVAAIVKVHTATVTVTVAFTPESYKRKPLAFAF